jgi:hypothetical protein
MGGNCLLQYCHPVPYIVYSHQLLKVMYITALKRRPSAHRIKPQIILTVHLLPTCHVLQLSSARLSSPFTTILPNTSACVFADASIRRLLNVSPVREAFAAVPEWYQGHLWAVVVDQWIDLYSSRSQNGQLNSV